ncbi:MAG TPA: hypothetical protein VFC15_14925 [Candidatus Limnocylindrales bacterium]|jgi:hypothetical protein|nr:hypothetical protein [Candidatus Limnocylindrales bacterium]
MERRYLVATLALVATFAIFSREFRSGHLANLPCPRAALKAEIACARQYLAEQFDAKIRPLVDRGIPDEQQMVAELNLPVLAAANERVAEVQAKIAEGVAEKQCDAAVRAQNNALRAQERSLRDVERMQERAAEISARAQERAMAMNERTTMRAQEISTRAMERAQRAVEKSQWKMDKFQFKMIQPNAPLAPNAPVAPMPIDFEVNLPSDFSQQVQAAVEGRVTVKCVRTKVAAQQYQTVMIQRGNQNMANNVHVVVSTQDVSGLTALTQSAKSQTALRRIERDVQRFQDHIMRSVDRAFATL